MRGCRGPAEDVPGDGALQAAHTGRPSALGEGDARARRDVGKVKSKRKKNHRTRKVGKGLGAGGSPKAWGTRAGAASDEEGALAPRREAGGPQRWRGGQGAAGTPRGLESQGGRRRKRGGGAQAGGRTPSPSLWLRKRKTARPAGKGLRKPGAPTGSRRPPSRRSEATTRWYAPAPAPPGGPALRDPPPPTLWLRGEGCTHSVPAAAASWRHVGEGRG